MSRIDRCLWGLIICVAGTSALQARESLAVGHQAIFKTGERCIACHSNLVGPSGEDVSIGYAWRASMMAHSSRDPYWRAAVRREVMDHKHAQEQIEDTCATCHMPMARVEANRRGERARVLANVAASDVALSHDGVSCTVCHQIRGDNFGSPASFDGGFSIDTHTSGKAREIFGPFNVDQGRRSVMQSATRFVPAEAPHVQQSELCATCHTLYTHALNEAGEQIGTLPEQVPYLEWTHSEYRATRSCQSCHMPQVARDVPISSVLGQPRAGLSQHVFEGGNAFMLRILNKYRDELGVSALPQELDLAARRTVDFLTGQTARLKIDSVQRLGARLKVSVSIENLSGHKLPTAYPSRRAWLHLVVRDTGGNVLFESGALRPDGSIVGNDNDGDGGRFEPHHALIEQAGQVQIYESIMADQAGRVTTGLLSGVRYVKDNRLLPRGFEKTTAPADCAVVGDASTDEDFVGGRDRVAYAIDVGGAEVPLRVEAELLFQTISYRWANNLKAYDAVETRQFVSYYEETAVESAVRLASDTVITAD